MAAVGIGAIAASMGVELFNRIPASFTAILVVVPIVTSLLTPAVLFATVVAWKESYWTVGRRIHYSLFAFAALGLTWFYYYWNVLGFQY